MTNETWIVDADNPSTPPRVFEPRQFDVLYTVEYHEHGSHFFVLCNADRHRNFTMYYTPISATSKEDWTEFLPYDASVSLQGMCCFQSHVVIYGRQDFKPYIRIVRLNQREEDLEDLAGRSHFVTFADPCYNCVIDPDTQNLQSNILRLTFSSLTVPDTTYDYNLDTRELIEVKRKHVPNYDHNDYQSEMLYTRVADGQRVAISVVYKKGLKRTSQNPCLMYAYGAYGSLTTSSSCFSPERLSLLDRGFVFAMAHVRGSGDNGKIWYEEGKLMKVRGR
jgi:oligopeptidase B